MSTAGADQHVRVANPILVEVVRNGFVESFHRGSVVAMAADGSTAIDRGTPSARTLVRSSSKPLLAVGMVRLGLNLPPELLALVCASHSGEPSHLAGVEEALATYGLDAACLRNAPDYPVDAGQRDRWKSTGREPSSLASNCSGKHAGMLATCRSQGWDLEDYIDADHPLQRSLIRTVEELASEEITHVAVDGCGAPAIALSLVGLATAFARLAKGEPGSPEGQVADAMRAHPELIGGTDRDVTVLMTLCPGLIAKDGAEAVYAAALPDGRSVALKIDDGAQRARPVAMVAALKRLHVHRDALTPIEQSAVLGHGAVVGFVRAAPDLDATGRAESTA